MTSLLTALGLGLFIGAQHAFEPDHLAAIGTMLPDESSVSRAAARGAWWGLGHGAAIASIGLPLILLGLRVPEALEAAAEVVVAGMLISLGVHAFWRARQAREREQTKTRPVAKTTLPIGLIHGLAGSGAAVVLATAQSPSQGAALIFLIVFVLGSTLSMTAVTGFLSLPLGRLAGERSRLPWLLGASGVLSVAIGLIWGGPHVAGWLA